MIVMSKAREERWEKDRHHRPHIYIQTEQYLFTILTGGSIH